MMNEIVEKDFWDALPGLLVDDPNELIAILRKTAEEYFQQRKTCKIYGSEISFEKVVPLDNIVEVCQDMWAHADKYSEYQANSESAYYKFLKFLWVKFPDGEDKRLDDLVHL